MPILFLILGDRLGLDMALASAPLHMFVRWRDSSGRTLSLETTSGAHPARDAWFRHNPRDVHAMLNKATACAHLIRTEFEAHYPHPFLIPMPQRLRYLELARLNRELFATAEGLGWRPEDQGRDDSTERSRSCS